MARTIATIQAAIMTQISGDATLSTQLTSTSRVAIFRLVAYIVAVCTWTLETLFDLHVIEVNQTIANKNPHTAQWYASMAKEFQLGMDLQSDGTYDNTGLTDDQVAATQIVSYAAVIEQVVSGRIKLRIKVAMTDGNGDLAALGDVYLAAFSAYIARRKDAGVWIEISSGAADSLMLSLDYYYDPLILNSSGQRIDGTDNAPVPTQINNFLKSLPFNGIFSINALNDALQSIDGYKELKINYAMARYGAFPFASVNVTYTPDAGYLRIYNSNTDLLINYIPYNG